MDTTNVDMDISPIVHTMDSDGGASTDVSDDRMSDDGIPTQDSADGQMQI